MIMVTITIIIIITIITIIVTTIITTTIVVTLIIPPRAPCPSGVYTTVRSERTNNCGPRAQVRKKKF